MIQGSLSNVTRQCGQPSCACMTDPAYRHGPHLYLHFKADGKVHTVYIPPGSGEAMKDAHRAWLRFQALGSEIAAENRERWLARLKHAKQDKARSKRP